MPLPRGIANCNPGNIRLSTSQTWQGQIDGADPDFVTFSDPKYGLRAIMVLLRRYYYILDLTTVSQIISRWAPNVENNTTSYVTAVSAQMKVDPYAALNICPETYISFAQAIAIHENGIPPITYPANWYGPDVYQAAYALTVPSVAPAS
jgi:hypothetical protein